MPGEIKPGDYVRVRERIAGFHPTWGMWYWMLPRGTVLRISRVDDNRERYYYWWWWFVHEDYVHHTKVEKIDPPPSRRRHHAMFVLSATPAVVLACSWHGRAGGNPERNVNAMSQFIEIAQQILENDTVRTAFERLLAGACNVTIAVFILQFLKSGGHAVGRWRDYSRKVSREKSDLRFNERREAEQREEAARERERSLIIEERKAEAEADAIRIAATVQRVMSQMLTPAEALAGIQRTMLHATTPMQPQQSATDLTIRPGSIVEFIRDATNGATVYDAVANKYRPAKKGDRVMVVAHGDRLAYTSGVHRWDMELADVKAIA